MGRFVGSASTSACSMCWSCGSETSGISSLCCSLSSANASPSYSSVMAGSSTIVEGSSAASLLWHHSAIVMGAVQTFFTCLQADWRGPRGGDGKLAGREAK
jgi:hypothetical protein